MLLTVFEAVFTGNVVYLWFQESKPCDWGGPSAPGESKGLWLTRYNPFIFCPKMEGKFIVCPKNSKGGRIEKKLVDTWSVSSIKMHRGLPLPTSTLIHPDERIAHISIDSKFAGYARESIQEINMLDDFEDSSPRSVMDMVSEGILTKREFPKGIHSKLQSYLWTLWQYTVKQKLQEKIPAGAGIGPRAGFNEKRYCCPMISRNTRGSEPVFLSAWESPLRAMVISPAFTGVSLPAVSVNTPSPETMI